MMHQAVRPLGVVCCICARILIRVASIVICLAMVGARVGQDCVFHRMDTTQQLHDRLTDDAQNEHHQGTQAQQAQGVGGKLQHLTSLRESESPCQARRSSQSRRLGWFEPVKLPPARCMAHFLI